MQWVCCDNPPGYSKPAWLRSAAMDDDGTVFVPAAVSGNEDRAFFMACFDGVPVVFEQGHPFLPSAWVARNFPGEADICALIERKMKEFLGA